MSTRSTRQLGWLSVVVVSTAWSAFIACHDDGGGGAPGDSPDAVSEQGGTLGAAGAPAVGSTAAGGAPAHAEPLDGAGQASGGDDSAGGDASGGSPEGDAGASFGQGGDTGTAGKGPTNPAPTICEQVVDYLTSCNQLEGASEGGRNCSPDNPASQCVVPCLLEKSCDELTNWPEPILECVDYCSR